MATPSPVASAVCRRVGAAGGAATSSDGTGDDDVTRRMLKRDRSRDVNGGAGRCA
jgi:hypothetical protein